VIHSKSRVVVIATSVLLSSCATDSGTTRAQGAGLGAVFGAVAGGLVGGNARSALIGGAAGGATGLVAGDQIARNKEKYAQREDALRESATRAHEVALQTRQQNEQTAGQVADLQQNLQSLRSRQLSEQERRSSNQRNQQKAGALMAEVNTRLERLRGEIERQKTLAAESKQASGEGLRLVANGISDLESSEQGLRDAKAQLEMIDSRRAY
jgi:gas vesicle protein